MKITMAPGMSVVAPPNLPGARIWGGQTERGTKVQVFVAHITYEGDNEQEFLEAGLIRDKDFTRQEQ